MSRVRVYHVSPLRQWLLWFVIGPILAFLVVLSISSDAADRAAFLIVAGLMMVIALPFDLIVRRTRLELSATGVRLRQTGYELAARWDDIEDLRLTPGREGFVTRAPMAGKGAARLARLRFAGAANVALYDAEQQSLLAERRFIPIEAFAWHLRRGGMREDIVRSAPHLANVLAPS